MRVRNLKAWPDFRSEDLHLFIYVDESGSFVSASSAGSWCVVAAYAVPEIGRKNVEQSLQRLKRRMGCTFRDELKLKDVPECELLAFLTEIVEHESTLFVTGMDLGRQDMQRIACHQADQVARIRINRNKMLYEEGRSAIDDLSGRVENLSPQLYVQMVAQIDLLDQVYRGATLYYAQRVPATLSSYRWRMDEKNAARPVFEQTLAHMAPAIIQARSLREPTIFVDGFDYTHFEKNFVSSPEDIPLHLHEAAGHEIKSAVDLRALMRDLVFVRSHDVPGVQVADLLASAWRRALRGGFKRNDQISFLLGRLAVNRPGSEPPIHLISLTSGEVESGLAYRSASIARGGARPMLLPRAAFRTRGS